MLMPWNNMRNLLLQTYISKYERLQGPADQKAASVLL
jgi:hypothetical protein